MRCVCVFICFLLWLIFTLLLSFTVIGLVISVSDEWQEMGDKIIDKVSMMHYIDYEDIIGVELIKN